ncbi:tRNA lysidine(34) synthetase TilS [Cardiobacterium sp. AH-315-I02]|nr:tRNA lysidine(34) synthetase TilS [Cardiobacterium sp. AH-315-I02]
MSFTKRFQASLESLTIPPENASYVVAYSGGIDSHVLLHCCKALNLTVRAVHVHHGLQTIADDWVKHCQVICDELTIHLDVLYVDANNKQGQSPEEAARNVRYEALQNNLIEGDCLLTAQHLNDQAETLLLQLFRTASSAGLSAMPAQRWLGRNRHLRPLLSFSRQQIENFAIDNALYWIEDPTNQDVSFDRNFVRKEILPLIKKRWPGITGQLSTVADLQSNNLQVLEDMAAIDLANLITVPVYPSNTSFIKVISTLSISRLKKLSLSRRLNVLRYWFIKITSNQSNKVLRGISPTRNLLEEIDRAVIHSAQDANPVLTFSDFEIRKFQNNLYLLNSTRPSAIAVEKYNGLKQEIAWQPLSPVTISALNIQIKSIDSMGEGLNKSLLNESLKIGFRKGGENFHPAGHLHSKPLKKWLQEANVPPWDRNLIPLVYFNDVLIAVAGLWVCQQYAVSEDEQGWLIDVDVL